MFDLHPVQILLLFVLFNALLYLGMGLMRPGSLVSFQRYVVASVGGVGSLYLVGVALALVTTHWHFSILEGLFWGLAVVVLLVGVAVVDAVFAMGVYGFSQAAAWFFYNGLPLTVEEGSPRPPRRRRPRRRRSKPAPRPYWSPVPYPGPSPAREEPAAEEVAARQEVPGAEETVEEAPVEAGPVPSAPPGGAQVPEESPAGEVAGPTEAQAAPPEEQAAAPAEPAAPPAEKDSAAAMAWHGQTPLQREAPEPEPPEEPAEPEEPPEEKRKRLAKERKWRIAAAEKERRMAKWEKRRKRKAEEDAWGD